MKRLLLLFATISLAGCVRAGDHPIPSTCVWTEDEAGPLDLTKASDRRHLRFDAVVAEDVAIRWADKHFSLLPEYDERCLECMEKLFGGVANQHRVDVATVRQYSSQRDPFVDGAVILSFGVLYLVVAYIFADRIRRRFPPGEPGFWVMTIAMAVGVSLVGVMAGGLWSIVVEEIHLNSGHLSYRMNRIPFRRYWYVYFACCVGAFMLATLLRPRVNLCFKGKSFSEH